MNVGTINHDMSSRPGDTHYAYLDRNNILKVIRENRPLDEVTSPTLRRFIPRFVEVCAELFPGITTDQNANAWVNDREWPDIVVDGELPGNLPDVLVRLANAAKEAALANPIAE